MVLLGHRRIRVGEGEADIQRAGSNFGCGMFGVLLEWFPWIYIRDGGFELLGCIDGVSF